MPFLRKLLFLGLLLCSVPLIGQPSRGTAAPDLNQLVRKAGYIFSGTVVSVEYLAGQSAADVATVRVTFHVEEAFRGVIAGQTLVIREWAALWNAGPQYRPGERVLLFLYPPSRLGLTSPVAGAFGTTALDSPTDKTSSHSWRDRVSSASPTQPKPKALDKRELFRAVRRAMEASHD